MKTVCYFFTLFLLTYRCYAQAPGIEWQNTIGGNGTDQLFSLQETPDKGFILGGISSSDISGDKTEPQVGILDYWVVKLDSTGNIEWDKTIGGDESDYLTKINLSSDGGFIVGGYTTSSASGDKTEDSWEGSYDYWILKLDSLGNIEWQNTVGGNAADYLKDIIQCSDGNYLAGGFSYSGISGDKTEPAMGETDYWVVKLDTAGNILWQNTVGGGGSIEILYDMEIISETSYFLAGSSDSYISGDKTEDSFEAFPGLYTNDYWIVTLAGEDSLGLQETIGGNSGDYNLSLRKTNSGKYILGGQSSSGISGDKTEDLIGGDDYWVMLVNEEAEIEWQNTIGTTIGDPFTDIFQTFDGNYLLCGYTNGGISGDKTEINYGGNDWWILKLDTVGNIVWQNSIAGNSGDYLFAAQQTSDGGYILGGYSTSGISVDKTEASMLGTDDIWIVKLYPDVFCTPVTYYADTDGDGFGNTAFSILTCDTPTVYVLDNTDCNDLDAAINPAVGELCNYIDDNCNSETDDGIPYYNFYADIDGDGFGNMLSDTTTCLSFITGYVADSTDCNDLNNKIHEETIYYADTDGDLYGDSTSFVFVCSTIPPEGYVNNSLDCDDSNYNINPGSNEIENGIDDNCNDTIDEGYEAIEDLNNIYFQMYPNPNDGNFTLIFNGLNFEPLEVEIYNTLGEILYDKPLYSNIQLHVQLPEIFSGFANVTIITDHTFINKTICIIK